MSVFDHLKKKKEKAENWPLKVRASECTVTVWLYVKKSAP